MITEVLGKLNKMRIEVFDRKEFPEPPRKTIFVQLNPEKYNIKGSVEYYNEQPNNASNNDQQFRNVMGDDVVFDFVFDSTGIIPAGKIVDGKAESLPDDRPDRIANSFNPQKIIDQARKSVEPDVTEFKNLLMGYNGETHQPPYLRLLWGDYKLDCRLKEIDIEYNLFRKNGSPIRAKVKCTFVETMSHKVRVLVEEQSSPDLTHLRTMGMDEKLPLLTYDIYEDDQYYIDVAKANRLLSFRKLKTGQKIIFPPVK